MAIDLRPQRGSPSTTRTGLVSTGALEQLCTMCGPVFRRRSADVSVALELRWAFGLEGGDSFAVILGTRRHAHGASDRL
jgi:hypothetical protein